MNYGRAAQITNRDYERVRLFPLSPSHLHVEQITGDYGRFLNYLFTLRLRENLLVGLGFSV